VRRRQEKAPSALLARDTTPIRAVPRQKREWWERLGKPVSISVGRNHGQRWSEEDIERIILASPERDTYQSLAAELGRSDGAVRKMRTWAGHILKGEYAEQWGSWVESDDRRVRANKHDVILLHKVLKERGYLDLPITEQFRLARPLPQPRAGWRGDRTGEALRRRKQRVRQIQALIAGKAEEAASE
jgi:hypothetical protein